MKIVYRHLEEGEIIQEGDEVDACRDPWRDEPRWKLATRGIGEPAPDPRFVAHLRYRRRVAGEGADREVGPLTFLSQEYSGGSDLIRRLATLVRELTCVEQPPEGWKRVHWVGPRPAGMNVGRSGPVCRERWPGPNPTTADTAQVTCRACLVIESLLDRIAELEVVR